MRRVNLVATLPLWIAGLLGACAQPGPSALDAWLQANPARIRSGESAILRWGAPADAVVTLDGIRVEPVGTETIDDLQASRTFHLEARRGIERIVREATIDVDVTRLAGRLILPALGLTQEIDGANAHDDVVPGEYLVAWSDDAVVPASLDATTLSLHPRVDWVRVDPATALALSSAPGVLGVTENRRVRPAASPSDPLFAQQWALAGSADPRFDLTPLWGRTRGDADVVIAVIDTGIAQDPLRPGHPHPDLDCGRTLPGAAFLAGASGTVYSPNPFEIPGRNDFHGTHVAGIAAACHDNGLGVAGVDPSARLLPIRIFDERGYGTLAEVLAAARWAAGLPLPGAPTNPHPADVINLSLGSGGACSDTGHPVAAVMASLAAAGTLVVAAAGNAGSTSVLVPAACPSVISVGAVGPDGLVPPYSNRGSAVDVFAPGGDTRTAGGGIRSTWADREGTPSYGDMQGTSMATPYVSGLLALLLSLHPDLTPARAEALLRSVTDPLTITCRTGTTTLPCTALVLDPRRLVDATPGGDEAVDAVLIGGERLFPNQGGIELTLGNGGDRPYRVLAITPDLPFFTARLFGPEEIAPGASSSIVLTLDRTALTASGLRGFRRTFVTISTDLGDVRVALDFAAGGEVDVGTIRVSASALTAGMLGDEIRRIDAIVSPDPTDGRYRFDLAIDLSLLELTSDDRLIIRAEGRWSGDPACPDGLLHGEILIPALESVGLAVTNLDLPLALACPATPPSPLERNP